MHWTSCRVHITSQLDGDSIMHKDGRTSVATNLLEFLDWIAARPRTYAETMEAWRTSCPRMPAWEDAIDGGLIQVLHGDDVGMNEFAVRLTPLGQAVLADHT